ncbi:MAG: transcriptional regulator [Actinobacteria bacterium]|nr:transcriptional regulator [Actinomycetota bacterium]
MYSSDARAGALALIQRGLSLRAVSTSTGVSRSTLRGWRDQSDSDGSRASCPRCADNPALPEPGADYAYLLGLYLGDGCISLAGARAKRVWKLRVICCDAWPGLMEECSRAMRAVRPGNAVMTVRKQGCTEVVSCSKHWPCLFPQHGPGRKHTRGIELAGWQRVIVEKHPGDFTRGLFHSDGYRGMNRVHRTWGTGERWYEYPRYLFTNNSADILRLCGEILDQLGVAWRFSKPNTISVARREAVERLDEFVGPKY